MSIHQLIQLLDQWHGGRVVVAGDFMLDRYLYGNADRLSPDAPVPVLAIDHEHEAAGGAANVCLDLRALRCDVSVLGVVGDDEHGRALRDRLEDAGCDTRGLIACPDRPTTVKQNFVGLAQHRHPQKMFRVDQESREPLSPATTERLIAAADELIDGAAVLCLEDYQKGVLSERLCSGLIERARAAGVEVLVDPAAAGPEHYRRYVGASCMTPNRTEAELATGRRGLGDDAAAVEAAGRALMQRLELAALVLTLDRQGAMLIERDGEATMVPTLARSVYDVTGAGDMVLAMLAAARANGAEWTQAVELANVAAGLEVERFGPVPIELDEVLLAVLQRNRDQLGKCVELEHLLPELAAHRRAGKRIVFTNGCFDILHAGHVQFLRSASRQGDVLVVGVNGDTSITRIKGEGRPVNRQNDRLLVLSELESVDYLVVFDDDTPLGLIEAIEPDVLVKGADYTLDEVVGRALVESRGGRVALVPLVEGRSTTNIIRTVQGSGSSPA